MREFLKTKGFKMTPQRELIFRSFFEMEGHVTVDELFERVRRQDSSIGYSTVWRNLKLICQVGLAEEVNLGDGVTRYDRVNKSPHGHMYCIECKGLVEFECDSLVRALHETADEHQFAVDGFRIEIQGVCRTCLSKRKRNGEETVSATSAASTTSDTRH